MTDNTRPADPKDDPSEKVDEETKTPVEPMTTENGGGLVPAKPIKK